MFATRIAKRIVEINGLLANKMDQETRAKLMQEQKALWDDYAPGVGFEHLAQVTFH